MNTNQKIANVLLTSRIRQLMVAVLSVTFGISMYVFMNSFMAGVNNEQTEIAFTSLSHIKIYNDLSDEVNSILPEPEADATILMVNNQQNIRYTEGIRNADAVKEALHQVNGITSVTTQLNQNVFIRNGVTKISANLSGIETANENQLFNTEKYMVEGNLNELDRRSNGIILGSGLAKNVGVGTGDNVSLITSDGVSKVFKVVGLIETGAGSDKARAMVSIQTARQLFSKNKSYATEVLINVDNFNKAPQIAAQISRLTSYKVESWQEGSAQLDSANALRDIIAIAVSLTILIVAGFGIYNIMNMTVNEKIKDIAILKAMGFNGKDVLEIFLTQSVVIGLIGGLTGLGLGNVISKIIDNIPFQMGPLTTLPLSYNTSDYIMAFAYGIIITFLAGYLPARKASKLDPVEILRG
ncbi:MAG: FtsX-like permease family protein [Bacteroidota bacterium]